MKTEKFIDPKSDYAFKVIFGSIPNKELTIRFLGSLLGKDIQDVTFHNVEMQKKRQLYFSDRVLYYASFAIQMQADMESEKFRQATDEERKHWNCRSSVWSYRNVIRFIKSFYTQ